MLPLLFSFLALTDPALLRAAEVDDVAVADRLLKAGADAKAANEYGVTPLSLACINGSAPMIEKLLTAGADPNAALPEGETPLMTAARTGKLDAVQVLLQQGARVNDAEKWRNQTALMWAAAEGHSAVVLELIKAGADLHARSKPQGKRPSDFTPLLFAVRNGHIDTVKVLLAAGADPNETLSEGMSALVLAAMNARYELGVLLLDHDARPNAAGSGFTALHQVVWTRRPNIHKTPAAVPSGNVDSIGFVKALVAHGADINARETKEPNDGNLGKLKRIGATPLLLAAKGADPEIMRVLLSLGADPLLMTNEHITVLEAAAGVGVYRVAESPGTNDEAFECVKIAMEHGGEINHVDDIGRTAMHGAALRGANNIVQYLFDRGAKLDIVDKKGWTPLVIAEGVFYPDVFKTEVQTADLLRKLGAKELEVSEAIRYAGMDKDGRESAGGYDTTVGRGSFEAPAKKKDAPAK